MAKSNTQWAAQWLVASELSRRGYVVSFTSGNCTPAADLSVSTPDGRLFEVDVKGHMGKNAWDVKRKHDRTTLYYVLVTLCKTHDINSRTPDRFAILTQAEANDLVTQYELTHPDTGRTGFNFPASVPFEEDAWEKLPPVKRPPRRNVLRRKFVITSTNLTGSLHDAVESN
ncbi:MAG TPA: hypothetical protein VJN94_03795 [Candidatus Binataceae bacterium]|nr:hypothetical protein [Candidatus Binataceae bacterium]